MKFSVSNTVWREDRDSVVGGRFVAIDRESRDATATEARKLVEEQLDVYPARRETLLADWDRQMSHLGHASVHLVTDGAISQPIEYGVRMSFHP